MSAPLWGGGDRSARVSLWDRLDGTLEVHQEHGPGTMSMATVIRRADVAGMAAALFAWLHESPGRIGPILSPQQYDVAKAELAAALEEKCYRDTCGHPMKLHGQGTNPARPSPCWATGCNCGGFR